MRISDALKDEILESVKKSFGDVPVFLFGSRTIDSRRGGDIDLAVETDKNKAGEFNNCRLKFITYLERKGIEYPFDVIQYNDSTPPVLKSEIDKNGIRLS